MQLFEELELTQGKYRQRSGHWRIFMILSILMRKEASDNNIYFPQIPGGLGRLLRGCGLPHGAGGDLLPQRVPRRARQRLPGRGQLADTGAGLVRPGGQ